MKRVLLITMIAILILVNAIRADSQAISMISLTHFKSNFTNFVAWHFNKGNETLNQDTLSDPLDNKPPKNGNTQEIQRMGSEKSKKPSLLTTFEFYLSIIILLFGVIIIGLEIYLIKTKKIPSEDSIKFIIITLIITSTLFLITAGYSNDQIAPAVGLLGTIAGYLLGKVNPNKQNEINEKNN